ncbi:MAG: chemotaxis protein CheW [Bacteroidota bacterium]
MENINFEETLNHYLVFRLGNEEFAVEAKDVREIMEVPSFTQIPRSPEYMKGVINLKGSILPVIDTHIKFFLPTMDLTIDSRIIVLNVNIDGEIANLGALVDEVKEVIEISPKQIGPSPTIEAEYDTDFIQGIAKVDNNFIMLLDIGQVFSLNQKHFKTTKEKQTETLSA